MKYTAGLLFYLLRASRFVVSFINAFHLTHYLYTLHVRGVRVLLVRVIIFKNFKKNSF